MFAVLGDATADEVTDGGDGENFFAGVDVPDFDVLFQAGRGDGFAIGAPGEAADFIGMAGVGEDLMSVAQVPDFDRAIAAAAGEFGPIGAISEGIDLPAMAQPQVADDARVCSGTLPGW